MKTILALAAVVAGALALSGSAGAGPCCVTNSSFESGLTGWTTTLNGGAVTATAGGAPGQGAGYARLTAGNGDQWVSISQTFFAPGGIVSGWTKFDNGETGGFCDFNDEAQVLVDGSVVWSASSYSTGSTPWSYGYGPKGNVGYHTITARVLNDDDSLCTSYLNVDGIKWNALLGKVGGP